MITDFCPTPIKTFLRKSIEMKRERAAAFGSQRNHYRPTIAPFLSTLRFAIPRSQHSYSAFVRRSRLASSVRLLKRRWGEHVMRLLRDRCVSRRCAGNRVLFLW